VIDSKRFAARGLLLGLGCLAVGALSAQTVNQYVPEVRKGDKELGFFAGGTYGLDKWNGFGGTNFSWAITKYIMPYVEYSFFPEIPRDNIRTPDSTPGSTRYTVGSYSARIQDIHGGVHIRAQKGSSMFVPYLVAGFGGLGIRLTTQSQLYGAAGGKDCPGSASDCVIGPASSSQSNEFDAAINGGAGVRIYTTERVGFRVEYKAYKPLTGTSQATPVFWKVEGGIFFQWAGKQ
jgi:hypothetical protein